jgi:DNA invertase Pin-like site-specific DNA recombinase
MAQVRDSKGSALFQASQVELLKAMGFPESRIRVIDEDQGESGTSTTRRTGWQKVVEGVTSGVIRAVAVSEVSRLGRDELDLMKFLWLCESKGVLIFENGIPRDLREIGDWTLVQIQAVLAEQENRRKTQRSQAGRTAKALTGIPTFRLPCGFDRAPDESAIKTANPAVREILQRVWREALQDWSVGRIARGLQKEGLKLPAHDPKGRLVWMPVSRSAVFRILRNPLYGGLLVLWRHHMERGPEGKRQCRTPRQDQQWLPGKVEAYVSGEEFERVQALMAARNTFKGVPLGEGAALVAGLVYCGHHGRRFYVLYALVMKEPSDHRRGHTYVCPGSLPDRGPGPLCMTVSGRMLDRAVEEIVLSELRCPSHTTLRCAIKKENDRRQATGRLLLAEVRRAQAEVAEARARLEDSRHRGRNPNVTQLYEDELEKALCLAREAERRRATTPTPTLIDESPAFLSKMAAVFDEFPQLWHSGRLGPQERKAVVRLVVRRIDIPETGEVIRVRVTLHTGAVLERVLFGRLGRRHLIETLAAKGFNHEEIATELRRRGILNHLGRPITAVAVERLLGQWSPRTANAEE